MPLSLPNIYIELDPSAMGLVNGATPSTLTDTSGNGRNMNAVGVTYRTKGNNFYQRPVLEMAGGINSLISLYAGTSIDRRAYTEFAVFKVKAKRIDPSAPTWNNGLIITSLDAGNASKLTILRSSGSGYQHDAFLGADHYQTNTRLPEYPGIIILAQRANGDTTRMYFNGATQDVSTLGAVGSMINGIEVGGWSTNNGGWNQQLELCYWAVCNAALSDAAFDSAIASILNLWPLPTKLVIWTGNSITLGTGFGLNLGEEYPAVTHDDLGIDYFGYNLGVGGQTIAQMIANDPAKISSILADPQASRIAATNRAVVAYEYTNSVNPALGNQTPAQAEASMLSYRSTTIGDSTKFVLIEPAVRSGLDAALQACSTLIEADSTHYNAIVPIGRSVLAQTGQYNSTTYFQADQVHLNATGSALVGHATTPYVLAQFIRNRVISSGKSFIFP